MAVITNIPAPPAIVAPASANKPAKNDGDNDFATELAAVQDEPQQKNDAQAKPDKQSETKPATETAQKDAPVDVTQAAPAQPVMPEEIQIAEATPETIEPQDIPLNKAPVEAAPEAPKPVEAKKEEVPKEIAALQQPLPVAQPSTPPTGNTNKEEKPDEKKAETDEPKQVQADTNTMSPPVAAPVTDVLPATLPTPPNPFAAQFGDAPKAETASGPKAEGVEQELRPTLDGVKPDAAKPNAMDQAAAKSDAEQTQLPAQPVKAEVKESQRNGKEDANIRSREPQLAQVGDKPAEQAVDARAAAETKPVVPQAPAQQSQAQAHMPSQAADNIPSVGAAQPVSQTQATNATSFASNVSFHTAHEARPAADQIAVAISTHSKDGAQNFEIRLDPPELGRVEVKMIVDDAGKTQASVVVERPHTLELLQRDSHNLERALKDSGLDLTQNGLNFSLKGQDRQAQQEQNAPFVRAKILNMELTAAETAQAHINAMLPSGSARLDIRV